jgi:signal peptidase I
MSQSSLNNGDPPVALAGRDRDYDAAVHPGFETAGPPTEPTNDPPATPARADHPQRHRRRALLAKLAVFVALAAIAIWLLPAFIVQPFAVPGDAMAPALQAGDRILVLKWGLLEGSVRRGEIVVFHPPRSLPCTVVGGRGGALVLRVVALPGEVIRSVGTTIFVDGRPLRERAWYDPRFGQVGSTPIRSTTLAPSQYFVMADNRSAACDSRVFGPISRSSVVGEGIALVGRHGHVSLGTL